MAITTVLLDADGVFQHPPDFDGRMAVLLEGRATTSELLDVERPSLAGGSGLRGDLDLFARSRGIRATPQEFLDVWLDVKPDIGVLALCDELRAGGLRVYVASNQQEIRGAHIAANLGYEAHFDGQFYSFMLGVAKPDHAFFEAIVGELGVTGAETLFVDDVEENVEAARTVGLTAELHDPSLGAGGLASTFRRFGLLGAEDMPA